MKRTIVTVMLIVATHSFTAPQLAKAATCVCGDDNITVSVITNDSGQLLDLAVVLDNQSLIERFPEATDTSADVASQSYRFSVGEKNGHGALDLDIKGARGTIKFRGKSGSLECNWG